jgi:endoglucanase Acf2
MLECFKGQREIAGGDGIAYVEDAAGNRSQANPVKTILIDTTTPAVQVTTLALSDDSGSSGGDRITNVASQAVTGTLSAVSSFPDSRATPPPPSLSARGVDVTVAVANSCTVCGRVRANT